MNAPRRTLFRPRPSPLLPVFVRLTRQRPWILAASLGLVLLVCGSLQAVLPAGQLAKHFPERAVASMPYRGTIRSGCAPNDAPSIVLSLYADEASETLSFNLWPRTSVIPRKIIRFDASHPIGEASFCGAQGSCEAAKWGEVEFTGSNAGAGVIGRWAIGLTGGRSLEGLFEADWLANQALCG